jgi:6-pyruvoyltetrahydropterin/6-carboxytetrahydropterin synthase
MITCTRRFQFCAGHRVFGHESKCANPHGHNYVALVEAEAEQLDSIGRVIDFSVLKERIGGWIEANWDHGFLVYSHDVEMLSALTALNGHVFVMRQNPTAENIAKYLLAEVGPRVLENTGVVIRSVTVQETENCSAKATL